MIDLEKEKAKGHCPSGINFHCPIILHWARRQTHIQGRSDRLSRGTSTRSQKDNRFMHLISSSNNNVLSGLQILYLSCFLRVQHQMIRPQVSVLSPRLL